MRNYHKYRVNLTNRQIASVVMNGKTIRGFLHPDNQSQLPKLYVVKSGSEITYIGKTTQNKRTRLRYGLKAQGETGYYGYMWKDLTEVEILIWCFPNKSEAYLETIEGELVYLFRKNTGKWPKYQMEIHFHNAVTDELEIAQSIYEEIQRNT